MCWLPSALPPPPRPRLPPAPDALTQLTAAAFRPASGQHAIRPILGGSGITGSGAAPAGAPKPPSRPSSRPSSRLAGSGAAVLNESASSDTTLFPKRQ